MRDRPAHAPALYAGLFGIGPALVAIILAFSVTCVSAKASSTDREKMAAYWGQMADLYSQALGDATSAFQDGNDRSVTANYLENCSTVARVATQRLDSADAPAGWDDVKEKLRSGFSDLATRCEDAKTHLYSGADANRDKARSSTTATPRDLRAALHLARLHYMASGGSGSDLRLAGT